ncbi:hypothetical protein [Neptuniibacter sp. QD37_11]|uniref:hypothetical protein n=1 Tax=Neptuniibacter sp. QD37_11 TaxID=3398209 RepID=UPI0039F59473
MFDKWSQYSYVSRQVGERVVYYYVLEVCDSFARISRVRPDGQLDERVVEVMPADYHHYSLEPLLSYERIA